MKANPMKTNDTGIRLIKSFEGCKLTAYQCPAKKWTIGYGHTGKVDGTSITKGMKITEAKAIELLKVDLISFEKSVNNLVKVNLTENQFAALVSFTYNVGAGNLKRSTLLRKLNAGDYIGAAAEFVKWNKAGGIVLAGLTRRRKEEQALFMLS
ncbi:MAG: muraminidase [Herbinix sp.]|jgi:GH24 family phage-related lysozyme (muramidase)|nr:muraminidase [Herbinix sp.]